VRDSRGGHAFPAVPIDLRQPSGPHRASVGAMVLKDRLFIALTVLAMLGAVALTGIVLFTD
jgi:hypothetical protein